MQSMGEFVDIIKRSLVQFTIQSAKKGYNYVNKHKVLSERWNNNYKYYKLYLHFLRYIYTIYIVYISNLVLFPWNGWYLYDANAFIDFLEKKSKFWAK
jgi:hypothetical protein